jgi:primase-polymerase (primpol)-like protein
MLTAVAFIIMQFQERNLDERNKAQRLDESMQQFQQQLRVEKSMQQQFDNIQKTNQILDIQAKQMQVVVELQKQVGELEKRIDELQNRLKEIEKRSPNKKNIQFRLIENNTPTLVPPQPQPRLLDRRIRRIRQKRTCYEINAKAAILDFACGGCSTTN